MANKQPFQLTARTLALSDVIPTQAADGATEVGKNTIQEVADLIGGGTAINVKVTLSSAEILAAGVTPVEIVAAPGAGKIIKLLAATLKMNFGTIAYATNTNLRLKVGSWDPVLAATSYLGATSTILTSYPLSTINATPDDVDNQPLQAYVQTGNPTAGDSTVDVYVTYTIITL